MKKILAGVVPVIALLGLAACDNTDPATTQGIEENGAQTEEPAAGGDAEPLEQDTEGTAQ